MGPWQSAQALLPAKVAPGISGASINTGPVIEQELSTAAASITATHAAAAVIRNFFIRGWPKS
jgi:hypothetical protein